MKKILAIILTLAMICMLAAACGSGDNGSGSGSNGGDSTGGGSGGGGDVTLMVWAAQEDQNLVRSIADAFIAQYGNYNVTINLGVVGEPDAWARFSEDPEAAADVFAFPNDQIRDFVSAGGLYEVTRNKDDIISRNLEISVDAGTLDGKLWGYPLTADNGYFLYYDKSVLSESDVSTLDGLMAAADAAGMKVGMDLDNNGYYVASFFLGAGGTLSVSDDGKQICDFNNANGLAAAEAMQAFASHPAFLQADDNVIKGGIGGTIAAAVSGIWNAPDISGILGDNFGATKLPTFNVNGSEKNMGSFAGCKLIGINATITDSDKLVVAMDFADFLTNEENQLARFEQRGAGPSNKNAANNPAVLADVALAALGEQLPFAKSQNNVIGSYWNPAGAFGTEIVNGTATDLQFLLDNMVYQIQS